MKTATTLFASTLCTLALATAIAGPTNAADLAPTPDELIRVGVAELIKMQADGGAWPYEGVYRVGGEIPVGYRIGGTAIVAEALLYGAAADNVQARTAIDNGVEFILKTLDHPLMKPSTQDAYDVRVWGHCYALNLFCRLRAAKRLGEHAEPIQSWIPRLVSALITEELSGGGWNYANRKQHGTFVTAPVTQTLLLARSQGEEIPAAVFERARSALEASRTDDGAFQYSGTNTQRQRRAESQPTSARATSTPASSRESAASRPASRPVRSNPSAALPGSIARSAICESTLLMLGGGSTDAIQGALDAFHEHWIELEKRRKKSGTHEGEYGIAPYYFYYGHRYAAQAIELLPPERRAKERAKLLETILRTRDEDGTWNDRVFARSRNFGTAMIVLALLGERQPMPVAIELRSGS